MSDPRAAALAECGFNTREDEYIVVAWAEPASGPGWANAPIRAIVQELGGGTMRQVWLQPEEQTAAMQTLYAVNAAATGQMTRLVGAALGLRVGR